MFENCGTILDQIRDRFEPVGECESIWGAEGYVKSLALWGGAQRDDLASFRVDHLSPVGPLDIEPQEFCSRTHP